MTDTKLQKPEEKSKPDNEEEFKGMHLDEIYHVVSTKEYEAKIEKKAN